MVPMADSERTASLARQVVHEIEKSEFSTDAADGYAGDLLMPPPLYAPRGSE
jgi:hypothetical protein